MHVVTYALALALAVAAPLHTYAQDLVVADGDETWTVATARAATQPDRIVLAATDVAPALAVSPGYDFFQGLASPHDADTWVYLEREQVGGAYRLVRYDAATGTSATLLASDNPDHRDLAYKPIAWTERPGELYVEGLYLDAAEAHEGIWVLSLATGTLRPVPLPFAYLRTPRLSPDRRRFAFAGTLADAVDPLHGAADVVYELDLRDATHRVLAERPGHDLKLRGWGGVPAVAPRLASRSTAAIEYYLPWDAGVELCVSRHGTPGPTGTHVNVGRCNAFSQIGNHGYAAVDFATSLSSDQNVRAAAAGVVSFAGVSGSLSSGYGRLVIIRHDDGTRSYYAHNKTLFVSTGQSVTRGQVIALEGTTGGSTGDHIHFEWRAAGGNASTMGAFAGIGQPRQDYRYRSNNTGAAGDTEAPTTAISAPGGTALASAATVEFDDRDDVGVAEAFYQVLERVGDHWYANRGNGFFNDNFGELYAGYTRGAGSWSSDGTHLSQTSTTSTNANLTTFLSQASRRAYLYEFAAQVVSASGPRKFGIHVMADDPDDANRGNSYLAWFSGAAGEVILYESVGNTLYTRARANVSIDGKWARYAVTYDPQTGVLEAFRNGESLVDWTDATPLQTGSYLSLRTNATSVKFDDLKCLKQRGTRVTVTAGDAVSDDLRQARGKIKSSVRDAAGNWSARGNLDVTAAALAGRSSAQEPGADLLTGASVAPSPAGAGPLTLRYPAGAADVAAVEIVDVAGRTVHVLTDHPGAGTPGQLDLWPAVAALPAGPYAIRVRRGREVYVARGLRGAGQ